MRRRSLVLLGTALVVALSLLGLRLWVARRIEASLPRPMICLDPRDRARLKAGQLLARDRALWVVKIAQFGADAPTSPGFWWHVKGMLIEIGYHLLWSQRGRDIEFARLSSRMRDCRWRSR